MTNLKGILFLPRGQIKVPIVIWLPLEYPVHQPIVYIQPSPNMVVRVSQDIEPNGRVWNSVLRAWNPANYEVNNDNFSRDFVF